MKSAHSSSRVKGLVAAGMLACVGFTAFAQAPAAPAPGGAPQHGMRHERMDPAKMQAFIAKRQAELKAALKITPAQEGAWTTYTAAMQPPARGPRPDRAEWEKLTTPQRIDKMREMHAKRAAEMDKRADATKTFYAALTPEQQKTFDSRPMHFGHGPHGHHGGDRGGRPGGPAPQKG